MPYATRQKTIEFPKKKSIKNVTPKAGEKAFSKATLNSSARKAFHGSVPGVITCREKELRQLSDFLITHLKDQSSGSIYISGLPGTGKTASVNFIVQKFDLSKKCHVVKINCASFKSSNAVFSRICEEMKIKIKKKSEKEIIASIEKYLLQKHKISLLILDEIDQLESKFQSVLYRIFEWASWENSKLILVGIANAMDLTVRNLPRLYGKVELKPFLLHFPPYTKDEISKILKNRLTEAGVDKVFAPGAVELIAAKVAGTSGDIRRALDLGRRVIELAEQTNKNLKNDADFPVNSGSNGENSLKRKTEESALKRIDSAADEIIDDLFKSSPCKLLKTNNLERKYLGEITPQKCNLPANFCTENEILKKSPLKKSKPVFDSENSVQQYKQKINENMLKKSPEKILREDFVLRKSPRKLDFSIDSKDVLNAVKNVFGQAKNFKPSEESSFPLHQKLVICTLLLLLKRGNKKDLTVARLHQVYSKICTKRGLTAVDKSGFLFLIRQVEVTGVLQIGKGVGALAKIVLLWDESEVVNSLKDLNENVEKACSVMDSPVLVRVERARQRLEGKSVLCYQSSPPLGHVIQRGLLWQQRDKLFARWKERYFILTKDYLHCFRKATNNGFDRISNMGPFIFKIKLVDVERVMWMNKKTYSAIALSFGRSDRILIRAQQGLEDWFDSLEECIIASKKRRHALKCQKEPYQGENEPSVNSLSSNVEDWLTARRKIAQLHRNYISDSVPDISKLDCPSIKNAGNLRSENNSFDRDVSGESCQRFSLLTDIDINALDAGSSLTEARATPTPCRLNKDVFFLPGLFKARQRSSIAGPEVLSNENKHQNPARYRTETDSSELKSRNLLGSFRIPKRFQTTRGLANRYSLMNEPKVLQFVYSTYENGPLSTSTCS